MSIMDRLRDFSLKDGKFRDLLNANQNVVVIVCVVVIAVAMGYIIMSSTGGRVRQASNKAWYYDTVSKEYFVGDSRLIAPITSPDGHPAVLAHFFTCTQNCDGDRFVMYYEKFSDEAKKKLEEVAQGNSEDAELYEYEEFETGLLFSLDAENWFAYAELEANEEFNKRQQCPDGSIPRYCRAK